MYVQQKSISNECQVKCYGIQNLKNKSYLEENLYYIKTPRRLELEIYSLNPLGQPDTCRQQYVKGQGINR